MIEAGVSSAPVLETARLRLRGFRASDLDANAAMLADPQVYRYLGSQAVSREDAWRKLMGTIGCWQFLGYGYWAVELKETGRMIGQTGFSDFKRDMTPSIEGLPEMGWVYASQAHGQGYASEANRAAIEWFDATYGRQEIVAIISPDNEASIRTARKAGFSLSEDATYKGEPVLLLRRPA